MPIEEKKEQTWLQRLRSAYETDRKTVVLVLLGVCGVVLLAMSCLVGGSEAETAPTYDAQQYTQELEERVEAMVSAVRGAGACEVMITLENGVEYIYANEEKSNSDRTQSDSGDVSVRDDMQTSVVTVEAADGRQGLLVTEIQPTVRGVVVACEGASDPTVAALVREAVRTALNTTDRRVCVIPLS